MHRPRSHPGKTQPPVPLTGARSASRTPHREQACGFCVPRSVAAARGCNFLSYLTCVCTCRPENPCTLLLFPTLAHRSGCCSRSQQASSAHDHVGRESDGLRPTGPGAAPPTRSPGCPEPVCGVPGPEARSFLFTACQLGLK